jgi:hypothetical protein
VAIYIASLCLFILASVNYWLSVRRAKRGLELYEQAHATLDESKCIRADCEELHRELEVHINRVKEMN